MKIFQSDPNIQNHHITQRIFEALSYGCIVITDHPDTVTLTDDIVLYANSYEDFIIKYNYVINNYDTDEIKDKIVRGYEWSKKYGTNRYSAKLFIDKINELGW